MIAAVHASGWFISVPPTRAINRLQTPKFEGGPRLVQRVKPEECKAVLAQQKHLLEEHEVQVEHARRRTLLELHETDCLYLAGRRRSASDLVRDNIFNFQFLKARNARERRLDALVQVLCSVPEDDYMKLGEKFRTGGVLVSVPKNSTYGHLSRVEGFYRREFYLAPVLEERPVAWVNYVAAHELGHLLHHYDLTGNRERDELAADATARRWGYAKP